MSQKDEWIDISKSKSIDEVRNTKEYKDWVKSIKERDDECCVLCGANQHLEAHHIFSFKNFVPLRLEPDNGITLAMRVIKSIMPFTILRIPLQ